MNNFKTFIDSEPQWPVLIFAVLLMIWTLYWKGAALWYASRNKEKVWFAVLLLINTLGILEIIYLLALRKQSIKKLYK